jgi:ATP-dependent Lhr-like helicase
LSAFDRLSPALQYQIVNTLGFQGLRDVQEEAAVEILEGRNCVVLAPTAGGKTEAAFFPLLSLMDSESWEPVSVIYVAPIRALLNNQEDRLERYAQLVGRRAFKWHGDVAPSKKKAFVRDPADILLTTPESLEVMLMSRLVPAARLFRALQTVVIDEIHAFVGDDRGGHLSAVLERLSRFCGRDVQRIGLSATVGNPADILAWAAGSSKREGRMVDPARRPGSAKTEPELGLDFVGSDANAAKVIASLHEGEKRLVFVDSRRRVESIGKLLREQGVDVHVTHSSLSVNERHAAEEAFARGKDCVIVATSALELGIDIGDLDRVIQIDAPSSVAAFLQRMGRTGRRGGPPSCLFLATSEDALVQAAAILRLHGRGFVEPVPLHRRAAHLLAHQIMALAIQHGGVPTSDWWGWISAATPFTALNDDDRRELVEHMLAENILAETGGRLVLGDAGERRYGRRNFLELYAVFQVPQALRVLWGNQEIGTIDALFAESGEAAELSFVLGARAWRAVDIRWKDGFVVVEPIEGNQLPRWQGSPQLLSGDLCQAMREILVSDDNPAIWSARARDKMAAIRAEYGFLDPEPGLDLVPDDRGYRLWTFAGGRANNLLGKVLESELGEKVTLENRYIGFRDKAAQSAAAIASAIADLRTAGRPSDADALRFASLTTHQRLSKFQPCLTDRLEAIFLADARTDPAASRKTLSQRLRVSE